MENIPNQVVKSIFPEERNRFITFLRRQKRNLRAWLIALILIAALTAALTFEEVIRFLVFNSQAAFNIVAFFWIVTIVIVPLIWPQKPGDTFEENFKSGVNPRIWDYEGIWKTELDENGKPVLSVTASGLGGLAIPCLSWTDYELQFDTRIMKTCTAWIVRAPSLNDCLMVQLTPELIRPHLRAGGIDDLISSTPHGLPIKVGEWISVRTLVRGAWVTIYVTVGGKEHLVLQDRLLGTRPPEPIEIQIGQGDNVRKYSQIRVVSTRIGSFGFRLYGDELAQFKNVRAYKLR